MKKETREFLCFDFGLSFFKGEISSIIKKLEGIEDTLKKVNPYVRDNFDIFLRFEIDVCTYEGYFQFDLYGIRLETDREYEERIKSEKIEKEVRLNKKKKQIEKEKAYLKKLLKKYGESEIKTSINDKT